MYDNIGSKIKILAKATFLVEMIAAVIAGIVVMFGDMEEPLLGLLIMVVGSIVAFVSTWTLYGYGELIDKTCEIARNTNANEK